MEARCCRVEGRALRRVPRRGMERMMAYASLPLPQVLRRSVMLRRGAKGYCTVPKRPRHFQEAPPRQRVTTQCNVTSEGPTVEEAVSLNPSIAQCHLYDIRGEFVPYQKGWDFQHALMEERRKNPEAPDALILVEHEPVYTLGTASKLKHVLFDGEELRRGQVRKTPGVPQAPLLVRTERGGEVTYHGPGQLVAYPILNLRRHKKDLHWYLRSLEEVVIDMLRRHYELAAGRKEGLTGVWVGDEKVCAMGLKVSRWITMHGLALNVCTEMAPFERIVPCGVAEHGVSSLHLLAEDGLDTSMRAAREHLVSSFCQVFGPYDVVSGST